MKKGIKNRIMGLLPGYSWACLGFLVLMQVFVFYAIRIPLLFMDARDLATTLDELIPLRPAWSLVYLLAFPSWIFTFYLLFRQRKEHVYRNSAAYLLTLVLTGILFLLIRAAIERPEVPGTDLFSRLLRLIYACDPPNNLCPSLHVVCSYYCWRCLFDTEGVPQWYRRFNLVFLLLVCCSVLFVKQHVFLDVPAGILVSEIPLQLAGRFRWERLGYAAEERIRRKKAQ